MKEKFQIMSKKQKIFNIIKTFFVQDVDHFIKTDGVRENQLACSKTKEQEQNEHKIGRKKRSTAACTGDTLSTLNTCSTNSYKRSQSCQCGSYGKVSKMVSKHSNTYEDRMWTITCESIPQYRQAEYGYISGARFQDWEISPHLNNAFVSGLSSSFYYNDRTYTVRW